MKKIIGVILLVGGLLLAIYGFNRQNSLESQLAGIFGERDNAAVTYIVAGAVAMIGGGVLLLQRRR